MRNKKDYVAQNIYKYPNLFYGKMKLNQPSKLIISLIGFSGSGKGTQGARLSKLLGIPHISLGDIIRHELRMKTKVGWLLEIHDKSYFPQFIPEQIFIGLLIARITNDDCKYGFILDGFPRTGLQAKIANDIILKNQDIHIPVFLDISEEDCLKRFEKRYICPACGHQMGDYYNSSMPNYCPEDAKRGKKVKLIHRSEDKNLDDLERRQRLIRENKDLILSILGQKWPVISIQTNNTITPDTVFKNIVSEIEKIIPSISKEPITNAHGQL
jgi:adenylate kinase